ncbi:MAG: hypothetical protein M3Q23_18310 [Actinomycetota bacterium]|nr:hypothetical protein [Actinomycetota bacterium]
MHRARTYLSLACVLVVVFGVTAAPSSAVTLSGDRPAAKQCGEWRWNIKTLSDKDAGKVNFKPKDRGVNYLRGLAAPKDLSSDTPRIQKVEFTTYSLKVHLLRATFEDDSDVHLVVSAPANKAHTMIVEFPDTTCQGAAGSKKKKVMKQARDDLLAACPPISHSSFTKLKGTATITGVGFWDEIHGQSGVAPNGIELHPVLSFHGSCSAAGGGGGGGGGQNCTPGYSPCLVDHNGADYDCYGGGGDGPYYTKPGVTYKVTGSDPYNLDSDGNGLGCE